MGLCGTKRAKDVTCFYRCNGFYMAVIRALCGCFKSLATCYAAANSLFMGDKSVNRKSRVSLQGVTFVTTRKKYLVSFLRQRYLNSAFFMLSFKVLCENNLPSEIFFSSAIVKLPLILSITTGVYPFSRRKSLMHNAPVRFVFYC